MADAPKIKRRSCCGSRKRKKKKVYKQPEAPK